MIMYKLFYCKNIARETYLFEIFDLDEQGWTKRYFLLYFIKLLGKYILEDVNITGPHFYTLD